LAAVIAALLLVVLAQGGSARSNPQKVYGSSGVAISVSQSNVRVGGRDVVTGSGFAANADATLTLESPPVHIGRAHTHRNGKFSATVTIPSSTRPGAHDIVATGRAPDGSRVSARIGITVHRRKKR
jgi:hypothetical protein